MKNIEYIVEWIRKNEDRRDFFVGELSDVLQIELKDKWDFVDESDGRIVTILEGDSVIDNIIFKWIDDVTVEKEDIIIYQ